VRGVKGLNINGYLSGKGLGNDSSRGPGFVLFGEKEKTRPQGRAPTLLKQENNDLPKKQRFPLFKNLQVGKPIERPRRRRTRLQDAVKDGNKKKEGKCETRTPQKGWDRARTRAPRRDGLVSGQGQR